LPKLRHSEIVRHTSNSPTCCLTTQIDEVGSTEESYENFNKTKLKNCLKIGFIQFCNFYTLTEQVYHLLYAKFASRGNLDNTNVKTPQFNAEKDTFCLSILRFLSGHLCSQLRRPRIMRYFL
jgi:hypothetical protein